VRDKVFAILGLLSQSLTDNKDLFYDSQEIWDELTQKGFSEEEIEDAVSHIERTTLDIPGPYWSDMLPVHRSYTDEECSRLSTRVRGYLWKLKSRGIIDHALEDEIIHKAMGLEEPAGLKEIKTVAALTVFGYEHKILGESGSQFCSESRLN
jgi:Smg protein